MSEIQNYPLDLSTNIKRETVLSVPVIIQTLQAVQNEEEIRLVDTNENLEEGVDPMEDPTDAWLRPVVTQASQDLDITDKHCNIQVKHGPKISQRTVGVQISLAQHTTMLLFQCSLCPYSSSKKKNLRAHMKTHTEMPFQCTHCPFNSTRITDLRRHLDHHETSFLHQCDLCSYSSRSLGGISKHRKIHNEDPSNCFVYEDPAINEYYDSQITDPIEFNPS